MTLIRLAHVLVNVCQKTLKRSDDLCRMPGFKGGGILIHQSRAQYVWNLIDITDHREQ